MATETMSADEDRLPWLEAVEDEDDKGGPSAAKLIGALIIGLVAIAAVIFAFFQLRNREGGGSADIEMIAAEDGGVYKERVAAPGGMKVEGEGDTAYAASEGADPDGRINLDAIPETPVAGAQGVAPANQLEVKADARTAQNTAKPAAPAEQPAPRAEPVEQPTSTPAAGGGTTVQLGAFSSNASAQAAWKSLSSRISALKPLNNSVVTATVGNKTVYRLRANVASRAEANTLCGKLKVAGESCSIVG